MKQSCEQFQTALSSRFDGENWDAPSVPEVAAHLLECSFCRASQEDLVMMRAATTSEVQLPAPKQQSPKVSNTLERLLNLLAQPKFLLGSLSLATIFLITIFSGSFRSNVQHAWELKSSSRISFSGTSLGLQAKASGVLKLPSGELAMWSGPAQLQISDDKQDIQALTLISGRCCFKWTPKLSQTKVQPLRLNVGQAKFIIMGTTWRAALSQDGRATLEVSEGVIKVRCKEKEIPVKALHQVEISAQGKISPVTTFNPMADPDFQQGTAMTMGER